MKRKVVVIGLGHLGAHVMEILAISGIANELVGIDYNKKKEWGIRSCRKCRKIISKGL